MSTVLTNLACAVVKQLAGAIKPTGFKIYADGATDYMSSSLSDIGELSQTLGLERIHLMDAAGRARIEYRAGQHMCHSGGVVQGGFVSGWIDAAMAHAAIAMAGPDIVPMSLELKVSFFAPVRPGPVFAEGWVERRGRTTCFFEGSLIDETGKVLAKASSTLLLASRERVEAESSSAVR